MVQLFVEIAAPKGRVDDLLHALQAVMRPARLNRGCAASSISTASDDVRVVRYIEEWVDEAAFEVEVRSTRMGHLLELLEIATAPPTLEVRSIGSTRGLEYFALVRGEATLGRDATSADG